MVLVKEYLPGSKAVAINELQVLALLPRLPLLGSNCRRRRGRCLRVGVAELCGHA